MFKTKEYVYSRTVDTYTGKPMTKHSIFNKKQTIKKTVLYFLIFPIFSKEEIISST